MNYKKVIVSMAVLTFVFSAGMSGAQAKNKKGSYKNQQESAQRASLILKSIESNSYEAWRKLVNPNSKIAQNISEEYFKEFVKARELARQGKYQEAMELYEDLKAKLDLRDKDIRSIVDYLGIQDS